MASPNTKQKRELSKKSSSHDPKPNPNRLKLRIGEQWPEGIVTTTEALPAREGWLKVGVVVAIVGLCSSLIALLTIHALATGNQQRLDNILSASWKALLGVGLWATAGNLRRGG